MNLKKIIILTLLVLAVAVVWFKSRKPSIVVSSFDDCVKADYPVSESYPAQCRTPDGMTFVQDIGNELEKQDLIRIEMPRPNTKVSSPLTIKGQARGTWFFEASFPVRIYDDNGNELGVVAAMADGEWMTEEFVPFTATLKFDSPQTESGELVLEKDNPSGMPENADQLIVPVVF